MDHGRSCGTAFPTWNNRIRSDFGRRWIGRGAFQMLLRRRCVFLDRAVHAPHYLPGAILLPLGDLDVTKLGASEITDRGAIPQKARRFMELPASYLSNRFVGVGVIIRLGVAWHNPSTRHR